MRKLIEKIIYYAMTVLFFAVLWKVTGEFWEAYVPWNYKTDLIAAFFVAPLLVIFSFILTSLLFKFLKESYQG